MSLAGLVDAYLAYVIVPLYIVSSILYIIRVLRGPTVPDMVLALSSLSFNTCFFLAVLAIYYRSHYPAVASLFLALWTFTMDLYVAKYLEYRAARRVEAS
ncbi:MAG: monovalent cation/H+ antiporter complex subunit F [Acidilobaceae archaeon]